MKTFRVMAIIAALFIVSCSPKNAAIEEKKSENYIVLLDLSDRLLNDNQTEQDINLIAYIFEKYESTVRNNLIINSSDRFRIVIAPQENMDVNIINFENELYLDMSKIKIPDKRIQLENFKTSLNDKLGQLYGKITENRTKSFDYQGANFWKYFNDYLYDDIENTYANLLFVITDGYFDFESSSARKAQGNRSTTSNFLNTVRGKANWKELCEKQDYGIIPIAKAFDSLSVCLLEIHPKYKNLDEKEMLFYTWQKWLSEMKIKNICKIPHSGLHKMEGQIDDFLEEN